MVGGIETWVFPPCTRATFKNARVHIDRAAIALYHPAKHNRQLATRFEPGVRVPLLFYRSLALWPLGYPEKALADADRAVND